MAEQLRRALIPPRPALPNATRFVKNRLGVGAASPASNAADAPTTKQPQPLDAALGQWALVRTTLAARNGSHIVVFMPHLHRSQFDGCP
jgi:hypothetical protein